MDDAELHDLADEINSVDIGVLSIELQIRLRQVKAIHALGYQVYRFGELIEDVATPEPSRWYRGYRAIRGWLAWR